MARRFRVIQYDGPEDWIIRVLDRSLPPEFYAGRGIILTWEIAEGDKIVARNEVAQQSDERFTEVDGRRVPPGLGHTLCAFYQNEIGECELCKALFAGSAKPPGCAVKSVPQPPLGDKPQ